MLKIAFQEEGEHFNVYVYYSNEDEVLAPFMKAGFQSDFAGLELVKTKVETFGCIAREVHGESMYTLIS